MNFKKVYALILSIVLIVLAGCGENNQNIGVPAKYKLPEEMKTIKNGAVSENESYSLSWDGENKCVLLERKSDGVVWSTIPYEYYKKNTKGSQYVEDGISSGIRITYVNGQNNNEVEANSNSEATYVTARKLKNGGIRVTYYFDELKISIPILYILDTDGMSASVEIDGITEKEHKVQKVTLLPFFVSAENKADNYLMVPSGSGALINTLPSSGKSKYYSEPVFGEDQIAQSVYKVTNTQSIKMPVFGAKNGENAILGIITEGADIAEIAAVAGDEQYGFSGAYAIFNLRGKTVSNIKGNSQSSNQLTKYTDSMVALEKATVKYIPLAYGKNDYNEMAAVYRNYLINNNGMKQDVNTKDIILTVYGGTKTEKLFLGIPYKTFSSMTTIAEAKNIVSDIKNTGASLAVSLKGFSPDGVNNNKIAGDFAVENKLGGKKELSKFMNWCSENGVDSFFDFNLMFYNESSKGFSTRNSATEPSGVRGKNYTYTLVTREQEETDKRLLNARGSLLTVSDKLLATAKKFNINGISLSDISSLSYSDYRTPDYYCKANMSSDVGKIYDSLKKNGYKLFGQSANSYAAVSLDYIFDSPMRSSMYNYIDTDIPFYQMVFRGSVSLAGETINFSDNTKKAFLKTVATGSSLGFAVCNNIDDSLINSGASYATQSVYSGNRETIQSYLLQIKPILEKVGGSYIEKYEKTDNVSITHFSNGSIICVNYGNVEINTQYGVIKPYSFICI